MPAPLTGDALARALYGIPVKLGVVIATTTSQNNHDTATPFTNTGEALKGMMLMLQPDVDCFVNFGTTNAVTASSNAATGHVKLVAGERFYVSMGSEYGWVAAVHASATVNLRVFRMA